MKCLLAFIVLLMAMGGGGAGCQSQAPIAPKGSVNDSKLRLTMYVRDASLAEAYYEVSSKGEFGFGGGLDARFTRASWTTPLTETDLNELNALIEQNNWIGGDFKSTNEPKSFIYRIDVRNPAGHRRHDLKGDHPNVAPVRDWLHTISLRRLEPDLQKLPEPGKQP